MHTDSTSAFTAKKMVIAALTSAAILTLQGCALAPDRTEVETTCEGSFSGQDGFDANCKVKATATWEFKDGSTNGFEASSLTVDLSNSSASLLQGSGSGVVTLTAADGSIHAMVVNWESVSEVILLAQPEAVELWASQFDGSIHEVSLDIPNLQFDGIDGPNMVTSEVTYDGQIVAGSTGSWYQAPSGCDGIFPDVQLCG